MLQKITYQYKPEKCGRTIPLIVEGIEFLAGTNSFEADSAIIDKILVKAIVAEFIRKRIIVVVQRIEVIPEPETIPETQTEPEVVPDPFA